MISMHRLACTALGLLAALAFASPAAAQHLPAAMELGGAAAAPHGHAAFCSAHREDCGRNRQPNRIVILDGLALQQLAFLNARINHALRPATGLALRRAAAAWSYPVHTADSKGYVLLKMRALAKMGWPDGALLFTVVRDENGAGRAVLTVRTNRGDLILDNKTDAVMLWSAEPFRFIKRQSTEDRRMWVSLVDERRVSVASLR